MQRTSVDSVSRNRGKHSPSAKDASMQAHSEPTAHRRRSAHHQCLILVTRLCSVQSLLLLASFVLMPGPTYGSPGNYPPPTSSNPSPSQVNVAYNPSNTPVVGSANSASSLTGLTATGMQVAPTPDIKAELDQRFVGEQYPNPAAKSLYEVLPLLSNVVGVHVAHVPGTDTYLFMERPSGYHPNRTMWQIAGTYDLTGRKWAPVDTPDGLFCCGHTYSQNGEVVIVGGHRDNAGFPTGMWSVRVFDIHNDSTRMYKVANMGWKRWYPTPTLLPDGKVLIMGGTQNVGAGSAPNPDFEIFDPAYPTAMPLPSFPVEPTYLKSTVQNYYPFNYVLPTGDVFNFCNRVSRILYAQTGTYRYKGPDNQVVSGPNRPGSSNSQFPFTATSVMTALRPDNGYKSMDIIVFGGSPLASNNDITQIAGRYSHRMTVSWSRKNATMPWNYKFSKWTEEDMGMARVMGDAVLLPNGDIILLNGAQTGCAGDSASGGNSRANYPTLWAQLYQPGKPAGERYTVLGASTIARMYHSFAALTTNGTVFVGGCDRCSKLVSDVPFFNPPPSKAEYRNEIFYPPYWFDTANKPRIISINNDTDSNIIRLGYGQSFMINWGSESKPTGYGGIPVTSVSIVGPSSCTHSYNTNQRVVFLPVLSVDAHTGTVWVKTPPNKNVAPPQLYMIYIMNGKTYSKARWIQLATGPRG